MEHNSTYTDNAEVIQNYLSGNMVGTELEAFEQRLSQDANLRDEVEFSRDLKFAAKNQDALKAMAAIQAAIQTNPPSPPRSSGRAWRILIAAAAVAALTALGGWAAWQRHEHAERIGGITRALVAAEAAEPYEMIIGGITPDRTDVLALAIRAYENREFDRAAVQFDAWQQQRLPGSGDAPLFYAAVSRFLAGQPEAALPLLDNLNAKNLSAEMLNAANWYKALALLQTDQADKSIELLERLVKAPAPIGPRAQAALNQLTH